MLAFVIGTGRCGSTLVQEVIARHPDVGFISNIDDKLSHLNLNGRWNGTLYRRMSAREPSLRPFRDRRRLIEPGRLRVAPSEGWNVLDRQVMSGFSRPCRDLLASDLTPVLERRLREFFDRRVAAQRCAVMLHKLTGWPRTGLLQAALPDARFIHVVRDGRAVANSWLQMGWWDGWRGPSNWYLGELSPSDRLDWEAADRSFAALAGLGWRLLMDAFDLARKDIPAEQWLDVRYEDVLAQPREQFERMLEFLGLVWNERFEKGLARHAIQASRGDAFRRDLDPLSLKHLDRLLERQLSAWGYPTE